MSWRSMGMRLSEIKTCGGLKYLEQGRGASDGTSSIVIEGLE